MNKEQTKELAKGLAELMSEAREIFTPDLNPPAMSPVEFYRAVEALMVKRENIRVEDYWDFKDTVAGHKAADEIMLCILENLGYGAGCALFNAAEKWYE
jgi:hypothetical protein